MPQTPENLEEFVVEVEGEINDQPEGLVHEVHNENHCPNHEAWDDKEEVQEPISPSHVIVEQISPSSIDWAIECVIVPCVNAYPERRHEIKDVKGEEWNGP